MTLKLCGAIVRFSSWSDDVGSEGVLVVSSVKVSKIPLVKRCERNVASLGGLVGVTLEIDVTTLDLPFSVRVKIGCRNIDGLPVVA